MTSTRCIQLIQGGFTVLTTRFVLLGANSVQFYKLVRMRTEAGNPRWMTKLLDTIVSQTCAIYSARFNSHHPL